MATLGALLAYPETLWNRIDDTDSRFVYTGSWPVITGGGYNSWQGTWRYSYVAGEEINFSFEGTGLRIICYINSDTSGFHLYIDDVDYGNIKTCYGKVTFGLVYEKQDLTPGVHTVRMVVLSQYEVTGSSETRVCFDCIDVYNSDRIKNDIKNMEIGDYIACRYKASDRSAGVFSELGNCTANEIPVAGAAAPDGKFFFIKVAKGLLIADRNVQTSITWDTIHSAKFVQGGAQKILGSAIPIMTSNTTPSGVASASGEYSSNFRAWRAMNEVLYGTESYYWHSGTANPPVWIAYEFPSPIVIKSYAFKTINGYANRCPKAWNLEAWDGTDWVILHQGSLSVMDTDYHYYLINNSISYSKYRLYITEGFGGVISLDDFKLNPCVCAIRSITGGVAFLSEDGTPMITAPSTELGAWPVNNEWDKYIVNSDLAGKILAGDNNVWNWSSVYSFAQETFYYSNDVVIRGASAVNKFYSVAKTSAGNYGFRPVLEYLEIDAKAENVWY